MNATYKFQLGVGGQTYDAHPLYKDDLAKEYSIEQGEKFYRARLSSRIYFIGADYDRIDRATFNTRFRLIISISWDKGKTWSEYYTGEFWKTDCKFDIDNRSVEVNPEPVDDYTQVLGGIEKEYDLIGLKPEIRNIILTKRPLIQVYMPGQSIISCFLSGMYWEQDCSEVTDETDLISKYHFAKNRDMFIFRFSGDPSVPEVIFGNYDHPYSITNFEYVSGNFTFRKWFRPGQTPPSGYELLENGVVKWATYDGYSHVPPFEIELLPVEGSGATNTLTVFAYRQGVYSRYLLDVDQISGVQTYDIPSDDIVDNNRNYHKVVGYSLDNTIFFSDTLSEEPSEWGIKQPGQYWQPPFIFGAPQLYPVGRSYWTDVSVWFAFSAEDFMTEPEGRKEYLLGDSYPLSSVISVLLDKIAPGITHEPTPEYSHFLYDERNPISSKTYKLFLTQKSNILAGEYTQPAQKAPVTLKLITDMLKRCFKAYWYIENGKFKIEHVQWFRNGGSYTEEPEVSLDLTAKAMSRNNKDLAYRTSQYEFNKDTMPERFEFEWADDVTKAFEGYPIDVVSNFVDKGKVEDISVPNVTTDVDYMLLNPAACSRDGFALLAASEHNRLPVDITPRIIPTYVPTIYNISDPKEQGSIYLRVSVTGGPITMCWVDTLGSVTEKTIVYPGVTTLAFFLPENTVGIAFRRSNPSVLSSVELTRTEGTYFLPFVSRDIGGIQYVNQNGDLAFINLVPDYYMHDLPAYDVIVNGDPAIANGISRGKKQTLRFPVSEDPDPIKLIKTHIGSGQIEKISINLSSRNANATLMYDTE